MDCGDNRHVLMRKKVYKLAVDGSQTPGQVIGGLLHGMVKADALLVATNDGAKKSNRDGNPRIVLNPDVPVALLSKYTTFLHLKAISESLFNF